MKATVRRARSFLADVTAPGDKSITHRAVLLGAIAAGTTRIDHPGRGDDIEHTVAAARALGVEVEAIGGQRLVITGNTRGLRSPAGPIDCGNAGTTMRLLAGLLAGAGMAATIDGDASLRRRPMARVLRPLRDMGATITSISTSDDDERPPFQISPAHLHGADHVLPISSAQVKSALLLAGLFATGKTRVCEPVASRDHTECMLSAVGAPVTVEVEGGRRFVVVDGGSVLHARDWRIPGDPSSAAFLFAAAALVEDGRARVRSCSTNPTRTAFLDVLSQIGARVVVDGADATDVEPLGDITVEHGGDLRAFTIGADEVPGLIDELPLLAVLATQAEGKSTIRGATELRHKESDRIGAMTKGLRAMGAEIIEHPDGWVIEGNRALRGTDLDACGDHRVAMALTVAGLVASGTTVIDGAEWVRVSYPSFFEVIHAATGGCVDVA